MYTIELEGLTYTGSLMGVTRKYINLKYMLGGDDGYAFYIDVTDPAGERFDMEKWITNARKLFEVEAIVEA